MPGWQSWSASGLLFANSNSAANLEINNWRPCTFCSKLGSSTNCPCSLTPMSSSKADVAVTFLSKDHVDPIAKDWFTVPIQPQADASGFSDSRTVSSDGSDKLSVRSLLAAKPLEEEDDAGVLEEFEEILSSEVHVEVDRLRELAKNGVPSQVRGQVWMFLLGVAKPDRSEEVSVDWRMTEEYNEFSKSNPEVMKRVKGEIKRYRPEVPWFHEPGVRGIFERCLSAYLSSHGHLEYSPNMVHLLGPLVHCIRKERDVYYCFEALMARHQNTLAGEQMSYVLARFMTLFRNLQPALYESFEEEEVEPSSLAAPWLQSLLCRELPLPCVLRLWDTYFSSDEGFDLHPYVCLSILEMCSEQLVEMDSTELLGFTQRLPRQDMGQIISNAYNLKEKVLARNLI